MRVGFRAYGEAAVGSLQVVAKRYALVFTEDGRGRAVIGPIGIILDLLIVLLRTNAMQQGCFRHKVAGSWCNSAVLGLLVLYGSEGARFSTTTDPPFLPVFSFLCM